MKTYSQDELTQVSDLLWYRVEEFLALFGIEGFKYNERVSICCPVHGGDNPNGCSIKNGFWRCFTHNCHEEFNPSMIGLTRGILSNINKKWAETGQKETFPNTLALIFSFLNTDSIDLITSEVAKIPKQQKCIKEEKETYSLAKKYIRKNLYRPAQALIKRGFSEEILDLYDIGVCLNKEKRMYNRIVVPIYDLSDKFANACLGRSIFPKCPNCSNYHYGACTNFAQYSKWINTKDWSAGNSLFNFWFAKDYIQNTGVVVLCEGPLDVIRLAQYGIYGLAVYGSAIKDRQIIMLESMPVKKIFSLMDNDEAGKKANEQIKQKCGYLAPVFTPEFEGKDIGEASQSEINLLRKKIECY